jgi:hypothetical protein
MMRSFAKMGLVAGALVAMSSPLFADQERTIKPDGVVKGFVSITEQTRIHIVGDRIRRIQPPPAGFEAISDAKTGDVFLNPLPLQASTKVTASYLITEKGHTVQLRLKPTKKAAEQVMITVDDGPRKRPVGQRAVRNAPYVEELVAFARDVIRGAAADGVEISSGFSKLIGDRQHLVSEWTSPSFIAEVIEVRAGSEPRTISETDFIRARIAGVWLAARQLAPGQTTMAIVIRVRG